MKNELHDMIFEHLLHPENEALAQDVRQWLAEDPHNLQTYQDIKFLWEKSAELPSSLLDQQQGWQQLTATLQIPQPAKARISWLNSPWKKIAAVIIPLAALGSYALYSNKTTEHWSSFTASNNAIDSLTLPDGSGIVAKPGTTLSYTIGKDGRKVKLQNGEAFFSVAKDAEHTFTIELPQGVITVLGTSFNVKISNDYSDVAIWDGSVKISDNKTDQSKILIAGNLGILYNNGALSQPSGNYAYRCAWSNHDLKFKDQEIETVIAAMASYYNTKLEIENKELLKKKITVRFNHLPLQEALLVLSEMLDLNMKKSADSTYTLTNK